jgi:Cu/Ag efflux protein CusF
MKHLHKFILAAAIVTSFGSAPLAHAQQAAMSEGEIKKVDKEAGKLTIKHGELKNLNMPGMTMVFKVQDAAMLDQVKPGDKVHFAADKVNGALTVTAVEVAK